MAFCYVLDTNFFVQAHRMYYPFDVFPTFWTKVQDLASRGIVLSIDKVRQELVHNRDELTQWVENSLPEGFFAASETVIGQYAQVAGWATSRAGHYKPAALSEFLHADEADAWLVAYSLADIGNRILITHEVSQPNARNRVKIPEACNAMGVRYMNSISMFRQLGIRF
ncbi:DUF4411 family protein [Olivibacter sitiensis]|uniref:DUF4411 family protein n=1 Tax=Olivibacter sitiensis TaxID=376470 RepID=UPI000482B4C0|nr:DUF4411 family protein [Olivibacter sitiensis]